jgi:hypothetical protein
MHNRLDDVEQKHMYTHKANAGTCKPMSAVFGCFSGKHSQLRGVSYYPFSNQPHL